MNVKQLARKGRSVLVEWTNEEGRQRSYVPYDSVYDKQGQVVCELAEMGIPFGVPWELLAQQLPINGAALQKELRRINVWTYDDLLRNTPGVRDALRQVGGERISVGQLVKLAAEYLQGASHD